MARRRNRQELGETFDDAENERLVQKALDGEEVIIARDGKPAVRLVPVETKALPRRRFGILKEMGWAGPDLPYEAFAPDPADAVISPFPGEDEVERA